jgi:hypothetical protein
MATTQTVIVLIALESFMKRYVLGLNFKFLLKSQEAEASILCCFENISSHTL